MCLHEGLDECLGEGLGEWLDECYKKCLDGYLGMCSVSVYTSVQMSV